MGVLFATILVPLLAVSPFPPPDADGVITDREETAGDAPLALIESFTRHLFRGLQDDEVWQGHAEYATAAVERMYAYQGWDSESDLFSLELIRRINAVPPWRVQQRFDALAAGLAERYKLDAEQEAFLRRLLVQESTQFFVRHATEILPLVSEAVQTRFAEQPFTTEQVTRWTHTLAPVFHDMRARLDEGSLQLLDRLEPDQQERLARDLLAANRRLDRVDELGSRWWDGDWDPADWGLDADPIQQGARRPRPQARDTSPAAIAAAVGTARPIAKPARPASRPADELDPWARYVRDFIIRYALEEAQQRRAWIIYERARGQRDFHRKRYDRHSEQHQAALTGGNEEVIRQRLAKLNESWLKTSQLIFNTMQRRLDRLLTRTQRARAATQPARPPEVSSPPPVPANLSGP